MINNVLNGYNLALAQQSGAGGSFDKRRTSPLKREFGEGAKGAAACRCKWHAELQQDEPTELTAARREKVHYRLMTSVVTVSDAG